MHSCPQSRRAFTRADLLAVLVVLTLLAGVSRPVWGNADGTRSLLCMDNLRQLSAAWLMFADDEEGRFVGNTHGSASPPLRYNTWAVGRLDWSGSRDNTNTVYLTDPRYAHLWIYLPGDTSVYKCPADDYVSRETARFGMVQRVRTYSMNSYVGDGDVIPALVEPGYSFYRRQGDFRGLPPSDVFVFGEEHPDSLNDPIFLAPKYSEWTWVDFPGSFHLGAGTFNFADGHVEQHAWATPETVAPVTFGGVRRNMVGIPADDPDMIWLRQHASEPY